MIEQIKNDINYVMSELGNIRNREVSKDFIKKRMFVDSDSPELVLYVKNFKTYRSMVDTLIKMYDNLNKIYNYDLGSFESIFVENFHKNLALELESLNETRENCKGEYEQYRCLSDAFIKLSDMICKINKCKPQETKQEPEKPTVLFTNKKITLDTSYVDLIDKQGNVTTLTFKKNNPNVELDKPLKRGWIMSDGSTVELSDNIAETRVYSIAKM